MTSYERHQSYLDSKICQIGDDVIFHSYHLGITIFNFNIDIAINRNAVAEWVRSVNNGLCEDIGTKLSYAHEKDFRRSG